MSTSPEPRVNVIENVVRSAPWAGFVGAAVLGCSFWWSVPGVDYFLWSVALGLAAFALLIAAWRFQSDLLRLGILVLLIFGHYELRRLIGLEGQISLIQPMSISIVSSSILTLLCRKRLLCHPASPPVPRLD
ncbi:MAG TPA: hypothetical protein DCY13_10575 [Verrucomicrobiales bacterium]|nr:hypothetical protein [Verrucomicrobiales bacterium]